MSASIDSELGILDNIQAADQSVANQTPDDPLQHIDPEELKNLDTLVVDLPVAKSDAEKASQIANEAAALRRKGVIHTLEAERLAGLVPALCGTKDEPVSYTSVPTSVGVTHAVELLENEAVAATTTAITKALDSIDRSIQRADARLTKFEKEWVGALASYQTSVEDVRSARGATPESDPLAYIGNEPAVEVLRRYPDAETQTDDLVPHLGELAVAILKYTKYQLFRFEGLFCQTPHILVAGKTYALSTLRTGSFDELRGACPSRRASYDFVLAGPSNLFPDTAIELVAGVRAMIERLRTAGDHLQQAKVDVASIEDVTHAINDATLAATFSEQLVLAAEMLLDLTKAATAFYHACATTTVVQVAHERSTIAYAKRRFFA